MTTLAGLISALVALLALMDWRRALLAVLLVGVLQDVFRKLTLGAPALYIVWVMVLYLLIALVALLRGALPPVRTVFLDDRRVQAAWIVFVLLIAFQLVNALLRWGSPAVPIFGALFYLGPPMAMLVSFAYADSERRMRQFLVFYTWVMVPACLTVYLSPAWQESWPMLRDVGTFIGQELVIYDIGVALKSYSGVLRAGEVASWHAATVAIIVVTTNLTSRGRSRRLLTAILIALLIGVIVLTGRRKMLMALSIFFLVQWALLAWFRKGMGKAAVMIILVGTLASFSFTLLDPSEESKRYVQRSTTVFGDATGRMEYAFMLLKSAFNRSAGVGLGAGSAAQGGRYAGIDQSQLVGGSAESGLGMFMVELGIPGLVAAFWLMIVVSRRLLANLRRLLVLDERLFMFQVSFLALLFANLMTFTVATQIYGDFFVLIILGTVAGFVVRINSLATLRLPVARSPSIPDRSKLERLSQGNS